MSFDPSADDADWLLHELGGKHRAQVLSTLAAIGLPDRLRQRGAATIAELGDATGCELADLESLVRAAAGLGCLREGPLGTFALTPRGEQLCTDRLGDFAAFLGSRAQWDPWSRLRDAMRDPARRPALEHALGSDLYAFLAREPQAAAEYDRAIDAFTRHEARLLSGRLDLAGARLLVDVGGGRGTLLRALLAEADGARGVLFDLPHVVDAARAGLPDDIDAVAGDFLEAVPGDGDVYLVRHVLHNWPDDRALRILQNCRDARAASGRIVVIDAVLAPDNRPDLARMLDLEMRVLCGGRERRKPELRRLIHDAGLRVERVEELSPASWLFVCR
ncbi:MAG: hypothetical protein KAI24_08740 [Planctomycetes bacterium]|nr:hypothetical protein [Planctomycetota bacterium]